MSTELDLELELAPAVNVRAFAVAAQRRVAELEQMLVHARARTAVAEVRASRSAPFAAAALKCPWRTGTGGPARGHSDPARPVAAAVAAAAAVRGTPAIISLPPAALSGCAARLH